MPCIALPKAFRPHKLNMKPARICVPVYMGRFLFLRVLCIGLSIICLLKPNGLQAQRWAIPAYAKAYRLALKFKIDSARLLAGVERRNPEVEAQRLLILSLADVISNLASEKDIEPEGYTATQLKRIQYLEDVETEGAWSLHAQAELQLHAALSFGRYDDALSAVKYFLKGYNGNKAVVEKYPEFAPARKTHGLFNALIGVATAKPNMIMRLANIKGDVQEGVAEERLAATKAHAQQQEAILLYAFFTASFEEAPERARHVLLEYVNNERDDLGGLTMLAFNYKLAGEHGRALAAIRSRIQTEAHIPYHYPLLLEGTLWLEELGYDQAIPLLEQYIDLVSGRRFVKDLHYRLFLAYYLKGDLVKANEHFYAIRTQGEVGSDGDHYANEFSKRGIIPDKRLLRARLLYDGGFYSRAMASLDSIKPNYLTTTSELAEQVYRRARIAQKLNDTLAAERSYTATITIAGEDPSYFAPMACLQLGMLEYRRKNYANADSYLERARKYPSHEYKQSIDNRAAFWLKKTEKRKKGEPEEKY
jgi:hypothetical protein